MKLPVRRFTTAIHCTSMYTPVNTGRSEKIKKIVGRLATSRKLRYGKDLRPIIGRLCGRLRGGRRTDDSADDDAGSGVRPLFCGPWAIQSPVGVISRATQAQPDNRDAPGPSPDSRCLGDPQSSPDPGCMARAAPVQYRQGWARRNRCPARCHTDRTGTAVCRPASVNFQAKTPTGPEYNDPVNDYP